MTPPLSMIMTPLPRDHPLWSIVLIPELADDAVAIVVVMHQVLADGLGGLNVLAALVDPGAPPCRRALPSAFAVTGESCPGMHG